jgi:hypothetical protein
MTTLHDEQMHDLLQDLENEGMVYQDTYQGEGWFYRVWLTQQPGDGIEGITFGSFATEAEAKDAYSHFLRHAPINSITI